jgi:hypothetical protein
MEHDQLMGCLFVLERQMIHMARDFAAFGSMVVFCATLAVWGDVLMALG